MTPEVVLAVLLAHMGATWAMIGLIWFVQVVHYPLFARVGQDAFEAYERLHQSRTTLVVGPLMLIELLTAVGIALALPSRVSPMLAWAGVGLVTLVWASTFFVQVPCHARLARGYDRRTVKRLVLTNWLRTTAWSVRGVVAAFMLVQHINA